MAFEKAAKTVRQVEIEMKDGSFVTLKDLTPEMFPNVKRDTKDTKTGGEGISLKRGIVSDDGETYVERRFFKRTNNDKVVLYDLPLPLTEAIFNRIPFGERVEEYVKGKRVSADAEQIGGKLPLTPEQQAQKTIDGLRAVTGMPKEVIEATIKGMRKAGFLNVN
jgi:hypothetical protein